MKEIKGIEKVRQARARLMLSQPFYGAASLNLQLKEDYSCNTAYTDGKVLGVNPNYINSLEIREVEFLVAHEVLHCIMLHPARQGKRDHVTHNKAGDYVINQLLVDAGLKMPQNGLIDSKYKGMSTEQVYDIIYKSQDSKQDSKQDSDHEEGGSNDQDNKEDEAGDNQRHGDEHGNDDNGNNPGNNGNNGRNDDNPGNGGNTGGNNKVNDEVNDDNGNGNTAGDDGNTGDDEDQFWNIGEVRPGGNTQAEKEQLENDWKINAVKAFNQARAAGKVPAGMERLIETIIVKKKDIEDVLRDFIQKSIGAGDYTWRHLNRRYLAHDIYLPGMRDDYIPDIVMVLDTSGSIDQEQINYFAAKINSVLSEHKTRVHIIYCDTEAHYGGEYGPEDQPIEIKPIGYGGTDFRPPFKLIDDMGIEPAAMIYMTDLECYDYPNEPHYPVLWALWNKYGKYTAPWGETVDITPE